MFNRLLSPEYTVHKSGIIVISGASQGIGKHAAFEMAKAGYTVYAGVRSEKDAKKMREEASQLSVEPVILEVTNEEHILTLKKKIIASGLPLVAVVNNAGISGRFPCEHVNLTYAKNMFEVNYFGAISLTHHLLPLLRQHKGRVLFVTSVAGLVWPYGSAVYSGTKRAMEAFSDALRMEMLEFGVSVSSIIPGYIKTNIMSAGMTDPKEHLGLTDEQIQPYNYFWTYAHKVRAKSFDTAPGPEVTSEAIKDAITNPYPRTRYVVGPATSLLSGYQISMLVPLLPERVVDYLALKEFEKLKPKN